MFYKSHEKQAINVSIAISIYYQDHSDSISEFEYELVGHYIDYDLVLFEGSEEECRNEYEKILSMVGTIPGRLK